MKKKELLNVALYLFAFLTIQAITIAVVMLVSQTTGITAGITTITTLVSSLITIALFYKLRWTLCSTASPCMTAPNSSTLYIYPA